jgi:hypothetical protein
MLELVDIAETTPEAGDEGLPGNGNDRTSVESFPRWKNTREKRQIGRESSRAHKGFSQQRPGRR